MARKASGSRELAILTATEKKLAECTELDEVLGIRGDAEAVRNYAKKQRLGLKLQNHAARIKIQAERRAGEALAALRLQGGDRKSKSHRGTLIVRLKDLGITRNQSSRWQFEASASSEQFAAYCSQVEKIGGEISFRGFRRFIRSATGWRHRGPKSAEGGDKDTTSKQDEERNGTQSPLREMISGLRDHLVTLDRTFAGICARLSTDLERIEIQEIPRYLGESLALLDSIDKQITKS